MISRFTTIKNIGRFHCCSIGARQFGKNTIIFGQNTGGKSTLTDIFWSFKTGDTTLIEGRKTFGSSGSQQVEFFDENNKPFQFPSYEWNQGFGNIEIFDTQFINENIFEGNEITYGHQKKLNSIIIGPKGKKLALQINALQTEINELTSKKTSKTIEFNRVFKREVTTKDFSALPKIEDVDEKIKELQSIIETAENQEKIKAVFKAIEDLLTNIISQKTKSILSDSIEAKADIVTAHILKTWKNLSYSKDFLQTGLSLTKDNHADCVFCGQELSPRAKALLSAYSRLFSKEYSTLQGAISQAISKFEKWTPATNLETIQDKLASINLSLDSSELNKEIFKNLKNEANAEFAAKYKDIGYNVNFNAYDSLIQKMAKIQKQVDELKKKNVFDADVDIPALKKKIKEFELGKLRHSSEWDDFIREYDDIDSSQVKKRQMRETYREQLHLYSQQVFHIHLDTINKVLLELNADFTICDFQPIKRIVGQKERIFALQFFNRHKVPLGETAAEKPNFKNTLSDSDKRVLAFAFFYSLMLHNQKLDEKIIVFDDPFSSFDSDRRLRTIELLANPHIISPEGELIEKVVNQLIILTHESEFFKRLYQKLDNPKSLRIVSDGLNNGVKKSTLVDCDVQKEFIEAKNKKDLKQIHAIYFANRPITNYEELCVKCRNILESIFTRKYLFDLEDEIKTRKSIRSFVEKLKILGINDFEKTPKQKAFLFLCDNLNIELHDNTLKNEGQNAYDVLGNFLKAIKEV